MFLFTCSYKVSGPKADRQGTWSHPLQGRLGGAVCEWFINDHSQDVRLYDIRSYRNDIVNAHQGRGMRNTFVMVSPAQRKLGEWPLHEINFQIKAKHVVLIDGVTTHKNRELG